MANMFFDAYPTNVLNGGKHSTTPLQPHMHRFNVAMGVGASNWTAIRYCECGSSFALVMVPRPLGRFRMEWQAIYEQGGI